MKYVKEMEAEREAIKAREPRAREEAWLTAGLRMMQGKSRHGLQNIGARTHPTLRCSPCRRTRTHTSDRFSLPDLRTATAYFF